MIGRQFESDCPTSPDEFVLLGSTDMLSTYSVKRKYCLDENGALAPLEEWDTIPDFSNPRYPGDEEYDRALTAKVDFEADAADENTGAITGTVTVPAGEKLHFVRTDCGSWVDMRMEDGTIVRLYTTPDWPQQVGGMPAEDILDGMMFAG